MGQNTGDVPNNTIQNPGGNQMDFEQNMQIFFKEIANFRQKSTSENNQFPVTLPDHDPDSSEFSTDEWIDHINSLKELSQVPDHIMILKAGNALRGNGKKFFDGWKPFNRSWDNFAYDLRINFPNQETWHTKLVKAATMESADFDSLCEYAIKKIRSIYQYEPQLIWEKVLCPVIGGITNDTIRQRMRTNRPKDQQELMLLLRQCDNENQDDQRRRTKRPRMNTINTTRPDWDNESQRLKRCFKCGKPGHLKDACRSLPNSRYSQRSPIQDRCYKCGEKGHERKNCKNAPDLISPQTHAKKINNQNIVPQCNFCQRLGHAESDCFKKNGHPKIFCLNNRCEITPTATVSTNNTKQEFSYLIDSGADQSIIHHCVVKKINGKMIICSQILSGFGIDVETLGICRLYIALQEVTLEIDFLVVPDNTIPGVDALIGWETIQRPGLQVVVRKYGLDLKLSPIVKPQIRSVLNNNELSGLDEKWKKQIQKLLDSTRNQIPQAVTTGKLRITLTDDKPVAFQPRRLAYSERTQLKTIIQDLLDQNIIRESSSPYASPIVLVKKKNGSLRLCVDYREVNKKTVRDRYPLPNLRDQLDALGKAVYFTTLDMKDGFHQIEIEEDSKKYTAFVTPDGHYEYNRMPFGFANAPSCYQRAINKALGNLKDTVAQVYLDDVMIASETIEQGFENLKNTLEALSKSGFLLNLEKCTFFKKETEYLGAIVGQGIIKPSLRKIDALAGTKPPNDVKGIRQFMGLAGYFRRFIKDFSLITAPITQLLKKNEEFKWTVKHEEIRQIIINILVNQPTLRIFNPELPTELHTDASSVGIGAILMQKEENVIRPVAYFSRKTTESESKYHSYDLETLAIVEGTEHFRVYLYGLHFTIYTDCNSVRATALKKDLHPRVARWWMKLQDFDFEIEYRPGCKMGHVDYLSRNPLIRRIQRTTKADTIIEHQANDPFCQELITSPNDKFVIKNEIVYHQEIKGKEVMLKCYVPISARLKAMKIYHDEATHIGWDKAIIRMKEEIYWPKMGQTFKKYIRNCRSCTLGKSHTGSKSGKYQEGEKATEPMQVWHIDHAGPLVKSNNCTEILVVIDAFAKFCMLTPIENKTAEQSVIALKSLFRKIGKPKRIIADRARAFTSITFQNYLKTEDIELHFIATGVPRGNGQVERVMRTLFNLMRSSLNNEDEHKWITILPRIEAVLNEMVCSATGFSPNALMFGTRKRLPAEELFLKGIKEQNLESMDTMRLKANQKLVQGRHIQQEEFDTKRLNAILFKIGDKVVVQDTQKAGSGKLGNKFLGPYEIIKILPNERYVLKRCNKNTKVTKVAAHEQLRTWPSDQALVL